MAEVLCLQHNLENRGWVEIAVIADNADIARDRKTQTFTTEARRTAEDRRSEHLKVQLNPEVSPGLNRVNPLHS